MLKTKSHRMSLLVIAMAMMPLNLGITSPPQSSNGHIAANVINPLLSGSFAPASHGVLDTVAGHKVLAVLTSENTACLGTNTKRLVLQATDPSVETFLSHSHPEAISQALEQIGLTKSAVWDWEMVSSDVSSQEVLEHIQQWNQKFVNTDCLQGRPIQTGTDGTEVKSASPSPGWAIIEDIGAGSYTDDNGQQVTLVAPTVGANQNNYSLFTNNVKSNTGYFMQNGFIFLKNTACSPGWADTGTGTAFQPYAGLPTCISGRSYNLTISRSGGVWNYCIRDNTSGTYLCQQRSQATGTNMSLSLNTSVWVENWNTNSNWYIGFTSPLHAYDAYLFRNGSPQTWSSQHRHTLDACTSSWPVGSAISGSLVSRGDAYFYLSGVPLKC